MLTITNFHFEPARGSMANHVMMYVKEYESYFHIWNIDEEDETPSVAMNIMGTRRRIQVRNKKKIAELIAAAKKMM